MNSKGKRQYKDDEDFRPTGMKIREVRLRRKISQEKLAIECNFDYSQINRMELGKVNFTIHTLFKVCRALQVEPGELLVLPNL
ncbi:MAG: helix-turn-helix transcriptional regulator [Ferruginibacter sp.]